MKEILVVSGDSNPGSLALATNAVTTELWQPSTSKTHTFFLYTIEYYRLLKSHTQQTTNYVPSVHLFGVSPEIPPPPEWSHNLWIKKGFNIIIIKFWPFIKTRLTLSTRVWFIMSNIYTVWKQSTHSVYVCFRNLMQHFQYTIVMISCVNELPYPFICLCLYIEWCQICKKIWILWRLKKAVLSSKRTVILPIYTYTYMWAWLGLLSQTLSAFTLETASSCCHQNLSSFYCLRCTLTHPKARFKAEERRMSNIE